jgi:hypothetical protein
MKRSTFTLPISEISEALESRRHENQRQIRQAPIICREAVRRGFANRGTGASPARLVDEV